MSLTAHTIVKNEDVFVGYAIRSVIDIVDHVIVFDTGSTDNTVAVVRALQQEFPEKIFFEEKGVVDKERHTQLRQEMVDRTQTEWFLILDGDEVWGDEGRRQVLAAASHPTIECAIAPFHLCVGDLQHESRRGQYTIGGVRGHATIRLVRTAGVRWSGKYDQDVLLNRSGVRLPQDGADRSLRLTHGFWHLSHLRRSSATDEVFSSGGTRQQKERLTWFWIGKKIQEPLPSVFGDAIVDATTMSGMRAVVGFLSLVWHKIRTRGV